MLEEMPMPMPEPDMSTMAMSLGFKAWVSHLLFDEWLINKAYSPNGLYFLCLVLIFLSTWFVNFLHNYKLLCRKNRNNNGYERLNKLN